MSGITGAIGPGIRYVKPHQACHQNREIELTNEGFRVSQGLGRSVDRRDVAVAQGAEGNKTEVKIILPVQKSAVERPRDKDVNKRIGILPHHTEQQVDTHRRGHFLGVDPPPRRAYPRMW
jgi:hypothetical protein